jgi:Tfp pilus assembly PilM family ATPase/Tfp pilus assembly protein PilN
MSHRMGQGIEIGADTVKAVAVRLHENEAQVLAAATFPRDALGVDQDDADAVARAAGARAAALGLNTRPALAALSGQQVVCTALRTEPERANDALAHEILQATGGEIGAFATNLRPLDLPPSSAGQAVVLAAASRNDLLAARSAAFAAGGMPVEGFCPAPVALYEVFRRSLGPDPRGTAALLDIGAEQTHVVLVRNGAFAFAGTIARGGKQFTDAVAEVLGVYADRADEIKSRRGAVLSREEIAERPEEADFFGGLRRAADGLAEAIQSTFSYARAQIGLADLEPNRVYLAGGGARLDGLREHLERALSKPVQWLDLGGWLGGQAAGRESVTEPPSPFGVALGLALTAADPNAFTLRLLPQQQRRKQRFWHRGVYAAAAAALVLLAIAASAAGILHQRSIARQELAALEQAIEDASEAETRLDNLRDRVEELHRQAALLADQARPNGMLLRTLDELRRALPNGVSLASLSFAPDPDLRRGSQAAITLRGAAQRREGAAPEDLLQAFLHRLRSAPLTAQGLRLRRTESAASRVSFEITFSPAQSILHPEGSHAPVAGR